MASWLTALLFATLPLRNFLPGNPPLGSWIDILVFFRVVLVLMISVGAIVTTLLVKSRDERQHQPAP